VLNDPLNVILLLAAAFGAGALNAVAGGGSFLTLPALVFTGMPPVIANATGTVALFPGYVSGALGFREDMEAPPGLSLRNLTVLSLVGGALGAALLLVTDDRTFSKVVPWLLLLATTAFCCRSDAAPQTQGQPRPAMPQWGRLLPACWPSPSMAATSTGASAFCCWRCSACSAKPI
jgi:uncharacterized membrane protein YfcA